MSSSRSSPRFPLKIANGEDNKKSYALQAVPSLTDITGLHLLIPPHSITISHCFFVENHTTLLDASILQQKTIKYSDETCSIPSSASTEFRITFSNDFATQTVSPSLLSIDAHPLPPPRFLTYLHPPVTLHNPETLCFASIADKCCPVVE
ncbi:hypothetical protein BLNAU_15601 [Blattamonas nauphoetae]|uniref:Uncharacterized protein n=1 Tax=Blattamonas nauphoetae TaxID=2049346 RepID=A0ABQ9XAL9_9EUKA|nr:hypothetical protein BLNAU_23166 [Blattamonas nauphoetae]KAK2949513.1 hypothetical protein BLNAU_15601 [Blattamonas nauphoetae]